jgi:hypothetical protein
MNRRLFSTYRGRWFYPLDTKNPGKLMPGLFAKATTAKETYVTASA